MNLARTVLAALAVALLAPAALAQDNPVASWEPFDFAAKRLEPAQLDDLAEEELALLRGIVFGRHGRVFKERDIQTFLRGRSWYKVRPDFKNSELNDVERHNLDVIRGAEAARHPVLQAGDLRWWRERLVHPEDLGSLSNVEYAIVIAEIEAIHGKRFQEPWLQTYFEERYWYRADPAYDPKVLSKIELANIDALEQARKRAYNTAIAPGDMEQFQAHAIDEKLLDGLTFNDLRLLRNEIYARRGQRFKSPWLDQYFSGQEWYAPSNRPVKLGDVERRNVDTIVAYERRKYEELSTKSLDARSLEGLFREDARELRNQIFARRGRAFKDPELQRYFSSFDWYRPDPKYTDARLTAVERENVATILAYEEGAPSKLDVVEG